MHDQNHLTDEELLRNIDRELPSRRQASAAVHLARCAACRDRQARLDGAAGRFTALYREEEAHSGETRHQLRSKLLEAAGEPQGAVHARLLAGLRLTPRWIAIGAAVATAVLVFRIGIPTRASSARSPLAAVERGALPIPALTPGATWNVSLAELCAQGARERRQIPAAVQEKVLREYRMSNVPSDEYELDYLITPELGGAADARNLWPQRYAAGVWNARVKDDLERLLPQLVCQGRVDLQAAQRDIADDWIAAYRKYFKTDVPLQRWARLSAGGEADDPDGITYPVWRNASAPQLELISFSARR
jgi:anti-sigma factor RsiW